MFLLGTGRGDDRGGGDGERRRKRGGGGGGGGGGLEWVTEVEEKGEGIFFLCVLGILRHVGKKLCEIFWGSCSKSC